MHTPVWQGFLESFMGRVGRRFVVGVPMVFLLLVFAMPTSINNYF